MARAWIDSARYSHVVVCPRCGYREVCTSSEIARDVRDRHDLTHPEAYRQAIDAIAMRAARRHATT